jgi:hypothetical protein
MERLALGSRTKWGVRELSVSSHERFKKAESYLRHGTHLTLLKGKLGGSQGTELGRWSSKSQWPNRQLWCSHGHHTRSTLDRIVQPSPLLCSVIGLALPRKSIAWVDELIWILKTKMTAGHQLTVSLTSLDLDRKSKGVSPRVQQKGRDTMWSQNVKNLCLIW